VKRALKRIGIGLLATLMVCFALGYAPDTDPAAMRAKYATAASQFIDVGNGLTIHVRDEGRRDGPVLVLLHGSNDSLQTWDKWAERLAGKYRVIRLDQIGHGLTGPNPRGDYSPAAHVAALDALMVRMGIGRFALGGDSMGGQVAWEYALAHPQKLTQLVLVDAAGPPDDPHKPLPITFRILQTPGLNRLADVITPRWMIARTVAQVVADPAIIDEKWIDRSWELLRYPGNRKAMRQRTAYLLSHGYDGERVSGVTVPTLVLWGAKDRLIPAAGADWFISRIKGSRKIVYPGIGHLPMVEAADKSAQDVDAFLSLPLSANPA
jgi:pimeloyl-ACP methyl ester carboxylesterase